jgi:hypothetical protein
VTPTSEACGRNRLLDLAGLADLPDDAQVWLHLGQLEGVNFDERPEEVIGVAKNLIGPPGFRGSCCLVEMLVLEA